MVLPVGLLLAILFGIGAYVQFFAFEALHGGPPSVEEAAAGEGVALMPTLADWLVSFLDWQVLLVGFVAAVIGLQGSTPKHFTLFTGVALAILITLHDVILHTTSGTFSGNQMAQNLVANLIGGAIASLFAAAALWIYEIAISRLGNGLGYRLYCCSSGAGVWDASVGYGLLLPIFLFSANDCALRVCRSAFVSRLCKSLPQRWGRYGSEDVHSSARV